MTLIPIQASFLSTRALAQSAIEVASSDDTVKTIFNYDPRKIPPCKAGAPKIKSISPDVARENDLITVEVENVPLQSCYRGLYWFGKEKIPVTPIANSNFLQFHMPASLPEHEKSAVIQLTLDGIPGSDSKAMLVTHYRESISEQLLRDPKELNKRVLVNLEGPNGDLREQTVLREGAIVGLTSEIMLLKPSNGSGGDLFGVELNEIGKNECKNRPNTKRFNIRQDVTTIQQFQFSCR